MTLSPFPHLIGGRRVAAARTRPNINPSDTRDVVGEYADGTAADARLAVEAARAAFPAWACSTPLHRHDILARAAHELSARREELGRLLSREEGKTLPEGIGEVGRAAQVMSWMAGEALRLPGQRVAGLLAGSDAEVTREPLGVIGIVTPWNFPVAIPAWKIGAALACGNTVVFKPAELVPASAWALVDILNRAGLPPGALNLVLGPGAEIGGAITAHPDVDAVSFTGSVATGRRIAAACVASSRMKRMQLEMGGKNPLVVLDDADLDVAVDCAVSGGYFSTGQRCTASSRFIVTQGVHDRFVGALTQRLRALVVDHALSPGTQIGPVVDQRQLDVDLSYIEIGRAEGAHLQAGGTLLERATPGHYLAPALFTDVAPAMRIAREEIFGPVCAVIRVKDYDEALEVANATDFGLAAGICTTSLKHAAHFKRFAEAGVVKVNQATSGLDFHLPFGGRKASSHGPREQGQMAVDFYTVVKTAYTSAG